MVIGAAVIGAMVSGAAGCFQETTSERDTKRGRERKREIESVAMTSDATLSGCYGEWVVW